VSLESVNVLQALSIWAELEDAYRGENGYGGTVAEIYAFRLMPHSPLAQTQPNSADAYERFGAAQSALRRLLDLFCEARPDASITIKCGSAWATPGVWAGAFAFNHRAHVRVERT